MGEVKKAMISQPMNGKSEQEIAKTREKAIEILTGLGYEFVNTLFTDFYGVTGDCCSVEDMRNCGVVHIPLCFLAKSLDKMSCCDAVYFCKGWKDARGCRIEYEAAKEYGLTILCEEEDPTDADSKS